MSNDRNMTVALPEVLTITVRGKTYDIGTANWSPETVLAAIEQGVTIKLQRADAGRDPADKAAAVQATVEALAAGKWARSGGGGRSADPVDREFKRVAKEALAEAAKAAGKKAPTGAALTALLAKAVEADIPAVAKWRAEAKRRVAASGKLEVEAGLDELFGDG